MRDNAKTLQRFIDLVVAGSVEEALELLAPAVVTREADSLPYPGDFNGREGFGELLQRVFSVFDLQLPEVELHDAGDTVVARMRATLTSHATGEVLDTQIVELYTFHEGLIAEVDVYYKDTHAVVQLAQT